MPSVADNTQMSDHKQKNVVKQTQTANTKASWPCLFAFTTANHIIPLISAIFFAIASSLLKPTSAIVFGRFFAVFTRYGAGELNTQQTADHVSKWCIVMTAIGGATWLTEGIFLSQWIIFGELQAQRARGCLFTGLLGKSMEWYDLRDEDIGTLSTRLQTQIRELQMSVSQPFGILVFEIAATVASLIVGFVSSWQLTLAVLGTFPLTAFALWAVSRGLAAAIETQKRDLTRASKYLNSVSSAIATIKLCNGQDHEIWQYFTVLKDITKAYLKQAYINALQLGVLKFFTVAIFVHGFWFGLFLTQKGLDAGNVVTTFYACLTAVQSVEVILPQWLVLAKGMSAGATLKAIWRELHTEQQAKCWRPSLKPTSCREDIKVNNVFFAYPSNPSRDILSNTTLFFPAGKTTYILGRSGSGKSTLSSLLLKFYAPRSGEITLGGHNINELNTTWVREQITLVQQHSILFNDTILRNINIGRRMDTSESEIWEAVKTADLEKTIDELADGMQTVVASNGKSLSGGQQQRVAIARARLRNTPVLILDEATSALDYRSQEKVNSLIRTWRKDKTTIIITHDIRQILESDFVYVMEDGNVAQQGCCRELLLESQGLFASFFRQLKQPEDGFVDRTSRPSASLLATTKLTEDPEHEPFSSEWISDSNISRHVPADSTATQSGRRLERPISSLAFESLVTNAGQPLYEGQITRNLDLHRRSARNSLFASNIYRKNDLLRSGRKEYGETITLSNQPNYRSKLQEYSRDFIQDSPNPKDSQGMQDVERIPVFNPKMSPEKSPANAQDVSLKQILGTIWPNLTLRQKWIFVSAIFLSFVMGAIVPAFAYTFALLLSVFYSSGNQEMDARIYSLTLIGVAVIDGIVTFFVHYLFEYTGQTWISVLRVKGLKRVLAQPQAWFEEGQNCPSRLSEIFDRNAEEMRNILGRFFGPLFAAFWMVLISTIWAMTISWKLTLITLATVPVMYLTTRVFDSVSTKWESRCNVHSTAAASIFTETFTKIRVVRAYTLEDHFTRKHDAAVLSSFQVGRKRAAVSGIIFGLTDSVSFFISALIFYYGAKIFLQNDVSVVEVLQVIQLLMFGIGNATATFIFIPQINSSRTAASDVLRISQLPQAFRESRGGHRLANPFPVVMKNLDFTYPSRPTSQVLSNIGLTLKPGTCMALVGPSGSGKSTIASLLLGLYLPSPTSTFTFDNLPVSSCSLSSIRTHISMVPQQPYVFPTTILANILYGLPEDHPLATHAQAIHAARDVDLHDFIMSLDLGYLTLVGEGGIGLSGGQIQKVAIARALVRKPRILVLDEATSSLDAISAETVRQIIGKFLHDGSSQGEGRCIITITHGIEMMQMVDEVCMLEDGQIVEKGSFEDLIRQRGRFCALVGTLNQSHER